jgi:hypothetical protein
VEIWHRITFGHKDDIDATIESLNVKHEKSPLPSGGYLIHIDISESDVRWPQIATLAQQKGAVNIYNTIFTSEETLNAEWIRLIPMFEQGYPQPEEGWEQIAYESECSKCGAGYRQKTPFRLTKEPRLGKHDFLCLYWTYTLFCTSKVLEVLQTHQIRGYAVWEAIIHRTNQPSKIVSQLVFPSVASPGLAEADKLQPETCPECGITKYASHLRGYMHLKREALETDVDVLQTHEWFGSGGHMGFREILISNRLARLFLDQGWRGIALKPVEVI